MQETYFRTHNIAPQVAVGEHANEPVTVGTSDKRESRSKRALSPELTLVLLKKAKVITKTGQLSRSYR